MTQPAMQQAAQLHRTGRLQEAAAIYQQVLRDDPRNFDAYYALAMIFYQANHFENAEKALSAAFTLNPTSAETACFLGVVLTRLERRDDALAIFDRALALRPGYIDALANRGIALQELNRLDEALAAFDIVLAVAPDHAFSWNNRANTLVAMGRFEDAVASFDKALAIDPNFAMARDNRDIALLKLGRLTKSPAQRIQSLFDSYADTYDTNMVEALGYRGHFHLRTLLDRVAPEARAPLKLLDLGSGTGLVGDVFKDLAMGGRLDGIDISPRMIEMARNRGIYDDLLLGDIDSVLTNDGLSYNLILAADTMVYIGDLGTTFSGVANRLEPDGWYLFAVEAMAGDGWEQTPAHRFRHSEAYMRSEAARAGLGFVHLMECTIRTESGRPVAGYAVALRKPAGG